MKTYKVRTQSEDEATKEQREFIGSKPLHNWENKSKVILRVDQMQEETDIENA